MNKKSCLFFTFIFLGFSVHAKQYLDDAILSAAMDITEYCDFPSTLVIDDFETDSAKMTLYIREQLADSIFAQNSRIKILTREHMDKIEKELSFQNTGKVSEKTIISVAKRLGASQLVFGKLEELNDSYILRIRILDVETGSYLFRKTYSFGYSKKAEQLMGRAPGFKKVAVGISGEINKNSIDYLAPGFGLNFDYSLTRKFAAGTKIILSRDFYEKDNQLLSAEVLALFRYYLASPGGKPASGFFCELQGGTYFLNVNNCVKSSFSGGVGTGFRFTAGSVYFEPELRFGYPYIFGAGFSCGMRF